MAGQIEQVLAQRLPFTYPRLCCKEIQVPPKIKALPVELYSKLWTLKILPWQVSQVYYLSIKKTHRRLSM